MSSSKVKAVPDHYHTVTPYLMIGDVPKLIEFAKAAFGAKELERVDGPDGKVMHAEVQIGDSRIMLGEARPEWPAMPTGFYLYVPDVDATYQQAVKAGGKTLREPTTEFYGDRCAGVQDAHGNKWWMATHVEDVAPEELARRAAQMGKK